MAVDIAKPDAHRRDYRYLELENGLKAVVASDEKCDKSGAAACMNVGMCHERKDLAGLAHFLEHMLFTGSKKYPKEGEYHEFLQQNGGRANAYTTCYFTNYHLEVKPEKLDEALDRFARFFTEPLLTKDCSDREINAVDSEFQMGHTQPWWRYIGIMNMSANPEHPFHVAVGNNKILRDEPKARGIDLYEEMKKLYESCYSANGMTLCVIGKQSAAELETIVKERFGPVVNKNVTMPIGNAVGDKPPFVLHDWHRLLLQTPVKDVKTLTFSWVIPYQAPLWRSKPTFYVNHLLGYEGPGSVIAKLKKDGLISGCGMAHGAWLQGAFSLMNVEIDLTDKGLDHLKEIGTHFFALIGMLQKVQVEKWIWEELCTLQKIKFKEGEDRQPATLCAEIAISLQSHPASEVLAGTKLLYDYEPDTIREVLAMLTLESVRVTHQAKCLAERCTEKDTSYDSPMKFECIPSDWLSEWAKAMSPDDGSRDAAVAAAAGLGLHLPHANPFIPHDLSLREMPSKPQPLPIPVDLQMPPVACIFHRQDDVFRQPKAYVLFHFHSPYILRDADCYMRTEMYLRAVEEDLSEYTYDATVAGLHYGLGISSGGAVSLVVSGFNDKLGVLLAKVVDKMRTLTSVPETIYNIVADAYRDEIRNAAFRSRPIVQSSMRFNEVMTRGSSWPLVDRWNAFQTLTLAGLDGLPDLIFCDSHVEIISLGNLSVEDARELAIVAARGLKLGSALKVLPERREAVFPEGSTVWRVDSTDPDDPNNAVRLGIQMPDSCADKVMANLLVRLLSAKFFESLRTQQQLGYIVQMVVQPQMNSLLLTCLVQTEFPPDYARSCIDLFLHEHFQWINAELGEDEFQTCCSGLLSELKAQPKNLGEEMGRYRMQVSDRKYDFGLRQRMIDFLEDGVTLMSLRTFVQETVVPAPRLYIQIKKLITKDDKPLPDLAEVVADPPELRVVSGISEMVGSLGKWGVHWTVWEGTDPLAWKKALPQ